MIWNQNEERSDARGQVRKSNNTMGPNLQAAISTKKTVKTELVPCQSSKKGRIKIDIQNGKSTKR
jgi:hypothetical protein